MFRSLLRSTPVAAVALALILVPVTGAEARGQGITDARISGSVRTVLREPVPRALVSLVDPDGAVVRSVTGSLGGAFSVQGIGPGTYSLRVEALGFTPRIYEGLAVRPGSAVVLEVVLSSAGGEPQVVTAAGLGQVPSSGGWVDREDFERLPVPTPDLESWASLSTLVDEDLGMEGLPGQFTRIMIDGIPFRPVRPLGMRTLDRSASLLTGRGMAALEVGSGISHAELPPGAGGLLSAHSRRAGGAGASVDGAGSLGGMRSAATDPDDAPAATSFQAGAVADLVLTPDTASLTVGADAWQVERPRAGLLPAAGDEEGVGAPYVERDRSFAGFLRLDRVLGGGGLLWASGRVGVSPAAVDLTGMAYGLADTGERTALVVGSGFLRPVGRRETLDVRVGLARSAWTSALDAGADLPFEAGALTAQDPETGLRAGPGPLDAGNASRLDLEAALSFHLDRGDHRVSLGARGGMAKHEQVFGRSPRGSLAIGSGAPTTPWTGAFDARELTRDVSVTVPRFALHLQDAWRASPELTVFLGGRYDLEWLPIQEVRPNVDWFNATELTAPEYERRLPSQSGFLGLRWAGADGFSAAGSVSYTADEVDPLVIAELITAQEIGVVRGETAAAAWPAVPPAVSSPDRRRRGISYFVEDPDAPATVRFEGGLGFTLSSGIRAEAATVFRRTDGLLRRRDLNRPVIPHGQDQHGRDLWGQPAKIGAWIGPDATTLGRFGTYGPAWELDQGGWSEYTGITLRLRRGAPGQLAFSAEYTWSRTEDNVPGIGAYGFFTGITLDGAPDEDATEGISDLDRPHRAVITLAVPLPVGTDSHLAGVYRFQSGEPFTPGYAPGVDANLDGIVGNEPAFVTTAAEAAVGGRWACLGGDTGGFATRNGCRGPDVHTLDLRLSVGLPGVGAHLFLDALNVLDAELSVLDQALLRVGSGDVTGSGAGTVLPFETNDGFGEPLRDRSTGRVLRAGVRIGR